MQYPTIAQPQYAFAPTMMAEGGLVPTARAVQSKGRGNDSMLVHMSPREVGGLQALAMQHGGSLSINPNTGLPEAGFLEDILPTVLGIGGTFLGIPPHITAMAVGGIETVRTGDLGRGLMAGLGAYGGGNLAGGLQAAGGAGAAGGATPTIAPTELLRPESFAGQAIPSYVPADVAIDQAVASLPASAPTAPATFASNAAQAGQGFQNLITGQPGSFDAFIGTPATKTAEATGLGGPMGAVKTIGMAGAPMIASALTPKPIEMPKEEESDYEGPYKPSERQVSYPGDDLRRRTSEFMYFTPSNPIPFAEGGETARASETIPDVAVSPGEARVYQDIMNVQRLAGLPALDPNRFAVLPGKSYEQFVYNPIEGAGVPASGSSSTPASGGSSTPVSGIGEVDYGFKPKLTKEDIENQNVSNKRGSGSLLNTIIGYDSSGNPMYKYDPNVPLTPFSALQRAFETFGNFPSTGARILRRVGFSKGGVPMLEDGGFVLTKKAVDGLGRGSNKKGQENARRGLGAIPIKGPGTGTSDSIKTSIEGKRPALVSNGEAYVPKKQVAKRGGAKAFYALMDKAEKQAKKAKRT